MKYTRASNGHIVTFSDGNVFVFQSAEQMAIALCDHINDLEKEDQTETLKFQFDFKRATAEVLLSHGFKIDAVKALRSCIPEWDLRRAVLELKSWTHLKVAREWK